MGSRPIPHGSCRSHAIVIRTAAAFWGDPGDDLVRVGDVAGLAVHAIRRVQADALSIGLGGIVHHFVYVGWAEILARVAKFLYASRVANVGVVNDQVRRLVLFMLGAGVVKVGELVEGQLAVAFGGTDEIGFSATIRRQLRS